MDYKFPKDFMFGTSTASYQIEGGWNEDGKGENIWDRLVHTSPEVIKDGTNGDIACDSYHKYKEDVAIIKDLNLKFYRFSISWARIAPSGVMNSLEPKGIAYYNNLINELIKNDIIPLVTMYHWDLPQYLQDLGGWVNPIMSDYFKEYARVLFTYFGDRVKWWITFNEPIAVCKGYSIKAYAPNLNLKTTGHYLAGHTQLIAHGKAYRLYEEMFKPTQNGKISISISGVFFMPKNAESDDDIETAERANQFERGWFGHPVYKGDYPPIMKKWVDQKSKEEGLPWSKLPKFTKDEIKLLKGTADFYALNHYSSRLVTFGSDPNPNFNPDASYVTSVDEAWLKPNETPYIIPVPEGLRKLLIWLKNEYGNPQLLITENGYGDDGQLDDFEKISYLKNYLNATLQAMYEDKCNVIGYTVWSLLDNFEWFYGYSIHFGLVKIDFNDPQRTRTKRESYTYFKNVVSTGKP
uniref:Myrosinase 1 n=1 Tax=Brevicoryne brassicae TaxID=69196 RepID=MYRO1_BREBR|nr:RecName: Full=Myrosinase 1; AltName: Full=Beta-glucosidase 1; AltName: Full=Beta-thioglucosidase 1; AltName: Full=Beta-thioglucosidase glucohydrolase 1; AltName: Full=Sinigrinase 1; AltName: Full=Thioglucosidase 1 [Brevicoryne brassicae]AAL25999.1 thioglucosidase [Brevicoryne brassicae]1WCG_A Chain A, THIOGLUCOSIDASE [Brevicoryne brassicae]1WCG_B Chain B, THIOGLUCOSIDASE [Brevicoryne brassicae]